MTLSPLRLLLLAIVPLVVMALVINVQLKQLDTARSERDLAQDEAKGLREAARITGERLAIAAALDNKHTQELNRAQQYNQDLQRAVDRGDQRLLVNATCPAVPAHPGGAGVADATPAELTADARSAYFTLRSQLALAQQMILGLQDHVRTFCPHQPAIGATR